MCVKTCIVAIIFIKDEKCKYYFNVFILFWPLSPLCSFTSISGTLPLIHSLWRRLVTQALALLSPFTGRYTPGDRAQMEMRSHERLFVNLINEETAGCENDNCTSTTLFMFRKLDFVRCCIFIFFLIYIYIYIKPLITKKCYFSSRLRI